MAQAALELAYDGIGVNDIVRTGPNSYPRFKIKAICGDKVWVCNVDTGEDAITKLKICRKITA